MLTPYEPLVMSESVRPSATLGHDMSYPPHSSWTPDVPLPDEGPALYEFTLYVDVPPDKADYLLERLCDTVEDYGYGWWGARAKIRAEQLRDFLIRPSQDP